MMKVKVITSLYWLARNEKYKSSRPSRTAREAASGNWPCRRGCADQAFKTEPGVVIDCSDRCHQDSRGDADRGRWRKRLS